MKKTFLILPLLALLLSACALRTGGAQTGANAKNALPTFTPLAAQSSPTPRPSATPRPTLTAAPTDSPFSGAEDAASAYAAALQKGDADAAAALLSRFSLGVANLTSGEAATQLKSDPLNGSLTAFKVVESTQANPTTVLVHVTFNGGKDAAAHDEFWPFRQENGQWLYNWANLIDFHSLTVDAQSTAGITFQPMELLRYSDHIHLTLMGQNHTNEAVTFGQSNETLATFYFAGKTAQAEKVQFTLERLRTYMNVGLDVKGSFDSYPDKVDIRTWTGLNVKPWFTFALQ